MTADILEILEKTFTVHPRGMLLICHCSHVSCVIQKLGFIMQHLEDGEIYPIFWYNTPQQKKHKFLKIVFLLLEECMSVNLGSYIIKINTTLE